MASLLDLLKKGGNAIKDAFTFTEEEKKSGKTPSVLERIPMRTAEARDNVSSFFDPAPDETRVRDVVRELPGATKDVAKEIAQGTARSLDFVGRKGLDAIFGGIGPSEQLDRSKSSKLEDILYGGRDKRVDTLAERGEVELGIDPEKHPFFAPVAGFGLTALDLVPGGQGKGKAGSQLLKAFGDDVIKSFAKTADRNVIETVIKSSIKEIDDVVAKELAEQIAGETTEKGVKNLIGRVESLSGKPKKIVIEHATDGDIKYGETGAYFAPEGSTDLGFGSKVEKRVVKPDAKIYTPKENNTFAYLESKGLLDEVDPKLKKTYGVDTLRKLQDADLDNPNDYYLELQKKAIPLIKKDSGNADIILLKGEDDLNPTQYVVQNRKALLTEKEFDNVARETPTRTAPKSVQKQTDEFIKNWTSYDNMIGRDGKTTYQKIGKQLTPEIEKNLSKYKPNESIVVYRFQKKGQPISPLSSWSKDFQWVEDMATGRPDADEFEILTRRVEPKDILVDIEKYSTDATDATDIGEVIVKNVSSKDTLNTPEALADARVKLAKEKTVNDVPREYQPEVSKALDEAEKETKKLSPRRLQDAKKYGISEDVFARVLGSKAGGRLSHEEASNLAETIKAPIKDLLEKDAKSFPLNRPKIEAYSQELQGYFQNVVKRLKAEALANPDDKTLQQNFEEASRTYMKARTTLEAVISEAGRVVEGSKVIGKYSRLPGMDGKIKQVRDQIVKFAEKNPKHANLPAEFDMALETVDVNSATELLDFLTQWNRASFLQKLSEFQKASMLSALSTHGVNALGNAIQQVLDIPVRALAGGLDATKSALTGAERTVYAGESLAQVRGAFRAIPDSIERAVKALRNEHFAQELRRTEIEAGTVVPAIKGRFGKVVRLPFRLLQSADLGFRTLKQGAESEALATRIAKTEGLTGKAYKERVKELSSKLPQDMLDFVDERVERSLMLEELTGILKSVEKLKNKYPITQFVIPFYRTLVNLSREAYRMTPIGGLGRTSGKILKGAGKVADKVTSGRTELESVGAGLERAFNNKWTANQATKMEELSRQIIGTTIMAWVVTNMLNGDVEITGSAPSNEGERETFYGQGKLPHAIRYGDTWVEFQRVQPIGQLLQIGASISEAIEAYKNTGQLDSETVAKDVEKALGDIGSMVFTQSPFTGLSDFFELIQGGAYSEGYPKAFNRWSGQMIGTFIPNVLRRLTVASDPIIYEKRDIKSQLKSRVPGLQKDLTPRRDTFGEIVRQGGNFASRFASPIRTTEAIEGSLYDEFDTIGYSPTVPNRQAFGEDLSVKEYETLRKYYGPRFRDELWAIINDTAYKSLNKEQKQDVVSGISRKVMNMARQELFPIYAEKNQLRKMWEQQGYTPLVIEDALKAKYPYDKETLELYAEAILEQSIESGDARKTIEDLLNS